MAEQVAEMISAGLESAPANANIQRATASGSHNGTASAGAVAHSTPVIEAPAKPVIDPQEEARRRMGRREFLLYAWGGAMALIGVQSAYAMFFFMYPRFRAGEFGGKFFKPLAEFGGGDPAAPPKDDSDGKFWMITTSDGNPKAIYMVCTHLGCLYKWQASNNRFECPCHGSKFSHDGFYIEGPAPRSLDYFTVSVENDTVVVDTGKKINGDPATESPARIVPT
jgi:cytochrome b6-f complex iron-sulfur subunit